MPPSARIESLPRENSPEAIYPFMILTPSLESKETPAISSKHTTSYWQTRPRCPVAMLTNIRAIVQPPADEKYILADKEGVGPLSHKSRECFIDFTPGTGVEDLDLQSDGAGSRF